MEQVLGKFAKQSFSVKINISNLKWPYIPDHPYIILIKGGSGSGKTNALLNLINNQPYIDKI